MRNKLLVLSLLAAPALSFSQANTPLSFEASLREANSTIAPMTAPEQSPLDQLLKVLREGKDSQEQIKALEQLASYRAATPDEEVRLISGLIIASDSVFLQPGVRVQAIEALSKAAVFIKNTESQKSAVNHLMAIALIDNPMDSRIQFRFPAVMGLAQLAAALPRWDDQLNRALIATSLEVQRRSVRTEEKFGAMLILHNYLKGNGAGVLERSSDLQGRIEQEIIAPVEAGVESLYADASGTTHYRRALIHTLGLLSQLYHIELHVQHRARQALIKISAKETDPFLKSLALRFTRVRLYQP